MLLFLLLICPSCFLMQSAVTKCRFPRALWYFSQALGASLLIFLVYWHCPLQYYFFGRSIISSCFPPTLPSPQSLFRFAKLQGAQDQGWSYRLPVYVLLFQVLLLAMCALRNAKQETPKGFDVWRCRQFGNSTHYITARCFPGTPSSQTGEEGWQ